MPIARRSLLAGAASALALKAAPSKWPLRLSTSSVMFNSLPVEDACVRIAAAGYDAVDLWQGDLFKTNHLDEALDRLHPDGLKSLLAANRLRLCSFTSFFSGIDRYAQLLGAAGGGESVFIRESRYYGAARGSSGATRPKDSADLRAQMASLLETLQPSLELAAKHNFRLAIENHSSALLNSLDSFKVFCELAAPYPRLGIALAPYHLQRDKIPVEDVIAVSGPRLLFFYAWQNEPETKQLPGVGSTDFAPWLKALAAADYRGYVNPFMHEALKAAPGEDRRALTPDQMSKAIVSARLYLEQCMRNF
jgi:sugar phosphate isomerase/epimerase